MPKTGCETGKIGRTGNWINISTTITSEKGDPRLKIRDSKTKRVKGNKNIVINGESSNRNSIFNNFCGMQDIVKFKGMVRCGYLCVSGAVNCSSMTTANNNFLI